ncbi:PA14 domain-containing protein [Toxoplasma gondii MAS]|uniref:PA14 domain-containing protein n=1 Tax=Toxoplasma gondii MAS TaxID=943118 RepID=A0A086PMM1_TOXGO|nr:PA14 domain-containing protein [Toxoplasma gondii MAS]
MMLGRLLFAASIIPWQQCLAQDVGYNLGPLQQLTQFRKQHRRTVDGRLCAAAFVQDDQTYTDCTGARAPDGKAGGEWCYVEVQLLGKGGRDWNWCIPPINYDKVRSKSREAFEMKATEAEKMIARLDGSISRVDDMLHRHSATCGSRHDSVGRQVEKIEKVLSHSRSCLKKVEEASGKIGALEKDIIAIQNDIATSRRRLFAQPENCETVPGYEDEPFPDGIKGYYYGNARFSGAPRAIRIDRAIDFVFAGAGPVEGLTSQQYSIRWDGYLLAPRSGDFTFSIETDSGVRVFLNQQPIIVDRMPPATETDAIGDKIVPLTAVAGHPGSHTTESVPLELTAGEKYKLRVELVHTCHFKYENSDSASLKLSWQSPGVKKEVISGKYFFTSSPSSPVKVSGLDPQLFQISLLYSGEKAFADSEQFVVADIPQKYQGMKTIRGPSDPAVDYFEFSANMPVDVYVASSGRATLPLSPSEKQPWTAHDTGDDLSVYRGTNPLSSALDSSLMKIWQISFPEGGLISLDVTDKGVPFLLFLEGKKANAQSCGGQQQVLSLVGGPTFAECEASSQLSEEFGCQAALNGRNMDVKNGVWRTAGGNGVGEYIVVRFNRPVQITHFRFKPRGDAVTWPSEIVLSFSGDGDDEAGDTFGILHTQSMEHNSYKLKQPAITNYVRATISQMYVNGEDSGGSFEFLGTACSLPEEGLNTEAETPKFAIDNCASTMEDIPELLPLQEGEQFFAVCPRSCALSLEGYVYGTDVYAPESSLCKAALHSGVCSAFSACRMLVTVTGPRKSFPASSQNGISSYAHGPSDSSLSFSKTSCTESLLSRAPIKYKISFGTGAPESGWLLDNGSVKRRQQGVVYGWLRPAEATKCPELGFSNPLNKEGILFPPAASSDECKRGADCRTNFWSLSVPDNGRYRVEVQLGNPCSPTAATNYLQVNGTPVAHGVKLEKGRFYVATADVDVTDKIIVLSSLCDITGNTKELCEDAVTTIMNVIIEKM